MFLFLVLLERSSSHLAHQALVMDNFLIHGGVAVDSEENILVVDSRNHRIQKFTANGQFLTAVGTKGNGPLQFDNPSIHCIQC